MPMIPGRMVIWFTILALCVLETPALRANPSTWPTLRRQAASRVIGMTVENADGDYLGKVKDLVVDLDRAEVTFVIISPGGFLSIGSRDKIAPAQAASMATTKKNVLALSVSAVRWVKAPTFRKRDLAANRASPALQAVLAFYGIEPVPAPRRSSPQGLAATKRIHNSGHAAGSAVLASDLLGKTLFSGRQESVGRVSDLLVDFFHHKSPFVVMTATGWNLRHEGFAVSLELIGEGADLRLSIDASRAAFESAPLLEQDAWRNQDTENPRIYRFENKSPDNTARNVRDRDGVASTPLTQSENSRDLRITQKIRYSLFHNSLLSFTAKNIKVITNMGRVTLRGPVKRDEERIEIVTSAAEIAGTQNVVDQLEVLR